MEKIRARRRIRESDKEKLADFTEQTENHSFHQKKMEQILRALDNDDINAADVNELRESLDYYLENHMDEDDDCFDDEVYDPLNLESMSARAASAWRLRRCNAVARTRLA